MIGRLSYPLELEELRPGEALERDGYRILAFPVHHGVSALGYALVEHDAARQVRRRGGRRARHPVRAPNAAPCSAASRSRFADGRVLTPDAVLGEPRPGRRIVLPGDTAPVETVQVLAEGADVLVHEATFSEDERERAADTLHSTARQAAEIASAAGVRLLALTHVSPRYFGPELARRRARSSPRPSSRATST